MLRKSLQTVFAVVLALSLAVAVFAEQPNGGNTAIDSFSQAKKLLLTKVYYDHQKTFYCGCGFNQSKQITERNGYVPIRDNKRANRIEWEHVVPAAKFGRTFEAWTQGDAKCVKNSGKKYKGRSCANKVSSEYRFIQADMYNLYPAVGEVNGLRSNFPYADIPGEERRFGECDMEIEGEKAEPAPHIRGNIARTCFYMSWAYPDRVQFSEETRQMLEAWDQADPVDDWERTRAERIKAIQGNTNPFVQ